MTHDRQRDTSLMTDVKLAAASALVTTLAAILIPGSPVWGAEMVFASGDTGSPSPQNGAGDQQFSSGTVQLKLDDGTTVSIVGPAHYSIDGNGHLLRQAHPPKQFWRAMAVRFPCVLAAVPAEKLLPTAAFPALHCPAPCS